MTLIILDGFDDYVNGGGNNREDWDNLGGVADTSNARFGVGGCLAMANGGEQFKTFAAPESEVIMGGAFRGNTSLSSSQRYTPICLYDGTTRQCTITFEYDGSIALRRGNTTGTIVAQTPVNGWIVNQHIGLSFRVKLSATIGEFQVYREGASWYTSASNLNNISSGTAQATKISLGASEGNSGTGFIYIDDFYAYGVSGTDFNTFPGDVRIYTIFPNGDDSVTWTHGANTAHYANVSPANAVDGWANFSSTPGQIDRFTMSDMPGGWAGTILCAKQNFRAWKDDAGVRQVRANLVSGATTDHGPTITLTGSATGYFSKYYPTDPATSAAWANAAAINALKAEIELVA